MSMTIQTEKNNGAVILKLAGRLDEAAVAELRKECTTWILEGEKTLVLDFAAVNLVSSVGVHAIFMAGKQMEQAGGALKLSGSHGQVARTFQISGLTTVFQSFQSLDEWSAPAVLPNVEVSETPSVSAWGWTVVNTPFTKPGVQSEVTPCEVAGGTSVTCTPAQNILPSVTVNHLPKIVSDDNSIASWLVQALCHPVACLDFCASWWRRLSSMELTLSKR